MARPRVPRDLLDPVVDYFKPQRVILLGSRARGEATRDSDVDLLVVVDDDTPPEKLTWQAGYEAHRSHRAADVFPMRAEDFERDRAVVNTLAAEADIDRIVVYGPPKGSCMKAPDPRARWQAVERRLRVAERDRRTVLACSGRSAFARQRRLPLPAGSREIAERLSDAGRQARRETPLAGATRGVGTAKLSRYHRTRRAGA
jgi:hypothetical protein